MDTQKQKIISILETGGWHCTSEFYAQYIADPRARLYEIKKKGIELECQTCNLHDYHKGGSKMWRLAKEVQIPVVGVIENEKIKFNKWFSTSDILKSQATLEI